MQAGIILAAGQGTRMRSDKQKVLHEVCGRPMLCHVLDVLGANDVHRIIVVVGHQSQEVAALCSDEITAVEQGQRLGTAHAVSMALPELKGFKGDIFVLYGDTPLLRHKTVQALARVHQEENASCTFLTTTIEDPFGYGRIIRNAEGAVTGVVEEKAATSEEREVREINVGVYCFKSDELIEALPKVKPQENNGEYYLTDVVGILIDEGKQVTTYCTDDHEETLGVNSQEDLARAEKILSERRRRN